MRISDWSSDVCSSDLKGRGVEAVPAATCKELPQERQIAPTPTWPTDRTPEAPRAGCPRAGPRRPAEGAAGRSGEYGSHRWATTPGPRRRTDRKSVGKGKRRSGREGCGWRSVVEKQRKSTKSKK